MKRNVLMGILLVIALSSVACGNSVKQTESNGIENAIATWKEQYDLGIRYLEEGDYEQAIVAFTTAIEIDPKQTVVYVGRAQAYIESGETEENLSAALTDYESALALDDMNPDIYLGIADVYIRQGDYENAKEILNQALGKLGENEAISEKLNELENGDIKDSDGKTHRRRGFDENGNLLWYHDLFYGTDGMESKVIAYTADGVETGQVECFYNGSQEQGYDYSLGTGELTMWRQEYDERGNVILKEEYTSDGDLSRSLKYNTIYDEKGNAIEVQCEVSNGENYTNKSEYDDDGNQVADYSYTDGELTGYVLSEYDSVGHKIRDDHYNADGSLWYYVIWEWDDKGNLIKSYDYNADGSLEYVTED